MASGEIETVRWGDLNSRDSLYGSALTMEAGGGVRLINHLMPGGTTLQEWYSFTDYQSVRDSPELPLLHRGRRYRIEPRLVTVPDDTVIFEVRFFDRFDNLVSTQVLYPPQYGFEFPRDAHYYSIRLVNGGCDELRFTSLTLLEAEDDG